LLSRGKKKYRRLLTSKCGRRVDNGPRVQNFLQKKFNGS